MRVCLLRDEAPREVVVVGVLVRTDSSRLDCALAVPCGAQWHARHLGCGRTAARRSRVLLHPNHARRTHPRARAWRHFWGGRQLRVNEKTHQTHSPMTSQTRHVSRTRHITSRSSGTRGIAHTHTGGKCTGRRRESQVHGAAESQWPQITEHLLLAATERLLQREQLAQPRQLASATPPAPGC